MNISQAKQEIKNSVVAYLTKNDMGDYVIPQEKQRPIFLMGPPGIGKTAIMEQIASEMNIGLLSYSMTHHTRQSALGLPFITKKVYGGKEYSVSEYTMSEIIASVYDMIENTGVSEGILFLDEINCVSETLSPIMLQFLQYKVFGKHKVPKGWVVVTAGNPLQFNDSAKDFDIVTWDRLKRIDIEPNFESWKKYAYKVKVHSSILAFLEVKPECFYSIETTVDGKSFATARGWEDLSQMLFLYEQHNIDVTFDLVIQYIQNKKIAKEFSAYYSLYKKYRSNYQIDNILQGKADNNTKDRAKVAPFDEKLALISLILDGIFNQAIKVINGDRVFATIRGDVKNLKLLASGNEMIDKISELILQKQAEIDNGKLANKISNSEVYIIQTAIKLLENIKESLRQNILDGFDHVRQVFNEKVKQHKTDVDKTSISLSNAFDFISEVFGEQNELLIFMTELTTNFYSANYITTYGCEKYYKYNNKMFFTDRQQQLLKEIKLLEL